MERKYLVGNVQNSWEQSSVSKGLGTLPIWKIPMAYALVLEEAYGFA